MKTYDIQPLSLDKPVISGRLPGGPNWIMCMLWSLVALSISALGLEGIFFMAHVGEEEYLKMDPILGFTHLENKLVTFRSEGYSQERINSRGHRDSEYTLIKPPDVVRIAVLGDSVTEAFQVPMQMSFAKLLEASLNKSGRLHVQVLNFGMSGYSTGQQYLLFLKSVAAYNPDITIVAYHVGDSDENVKRFTDDDFLPRPYFSADDRGRLSVDWTVLDHWLTGDHARFLQRCEWLRRHSRIWGVLSKLSLDLAADKTGRSFVQLTDPLSKCAMQAFAAFVPESLNRSELSGQRKSIDSSINNFNQHMDAIAGSNLQNSGYGSHSAGEYQVCFQVCRENWRVTRAIVSQLNQACNCHNSQLVVAALPAPSNSIFYFRELKWLSQLAQEQGFQFINVHEAFPSRKPMESSPFFYMLHLSEAGHQRVAETLVKKLSFKANSKLIKAAN